jgi:hypothetical protein
LACVFFLSGEDHDDNLFKSDHEFSCESDVPDEEAAPIKHARTGIDFAKLIFRPKTFRINFDPQILDIFYPEQNRYKFATVLWTIVLDFRVFKNLFECYTRKLKFDQISRFYL